MENCFLSEIINITKGDLLLGDPHARVTSISTDTRSLRPGDLFIALTGKNFDGHGFLKQAIEKKVGGLIISRTDIDLGKPFPVFPSVLKVEDTQKALGDIAAYYRRKWNLPLVGITGSNGKTTTKEMLSFILKQKGPTLSTTGNLNNQIGLPLTVLQLDSRHAYAVIEMGTSWPGEIDRLASIASPTVGIITNIGMSHLENFKSREGVLAEKRMLFANLREGGCAVINNDDPYLRGIKGELQREVVTYGIEEGADVCARQIQFVPHFPNFQLRLGGETLLPVRLPVYGKFNIYNALAAAAAAWKLGVEPELIKSGLENFPAPKMRMEVRNLPSGVTLINDAYNANPSSIRESIVSLVQSFASRDRVVVLGDMLELGEVSEEEHRRIGELLALQPLTRIYLYGPMMAKAYEALKGNPAAKYFTGKDELAEELKGSVPPNAVLFFKASRGMHLEEVIEKVCPRDE